VRLRRIHALDLDQAGEDWFDTVLWLWSQDECAPDGETPDAALSRFAGFRMGASIALARRDEGDHDLVLYPGGWVVGSGPGSRDGQVGVLVRPVRPARFGVPRLQVHVNVDRMAERNDVKELE
jgi:hypothetical protein